MVSTKCKFLPWHIVLIKYCLFVKMTFLHVALMEYSCLEELQCLLWLANKKTPPHPTPFLSSSSPSRSFFSSFWTIHTSPLPEKRESQSENSPPPLISLDIAFISHPRRLLSNPPPPPLSAAAADAPGQTHTGAGGGIEAGGALISSAPPPPPNGERRRGEPFGSGKREGGKDRGALTCFVLIQE